MLEDSSGALLHPQTYIDNLGPYTSVIVGNDSCMKDTTYLGP